MPHQHHSNVREGLLAGLIGGVIVALWYFAVDLGRGEPLYTPNVLGQVFVQADTIPATRTITSGAVVQYSLLHFGFFSLFGVLLAALTHLATRNPAIRMGVWLFLVIGCVFWFAVSYMLYWLTDQRFPWVTSLIGTLLGVGSMGLYLWRQHPDLRGSMHRLPLGAEVKPPPHPPGGPGA
jgi:hypothetical protein